jgi:hypothetical protein
MNLSLFIGQNKNASKKVGGREDQFFEPRHSHQPLAAF